MKKQTLVTFILISLISTTAIFAQENVPKEVYLNTINGVNEMKWSNLKTSELMEYNTGFADKVYDILESDKSEKDKTSALKVLNNDKEKDLDDLLGSKDAKKYRKLMEDALRPLIKKNKLLKYVV